MLSSTLSASASARPVLRPTTPKACARSCKSARPCSSRAEKCRLVPHTFPPPLAGERRVEAARREWNEPCCGGHCAWHDGRGGGQAPRRSRDQGADLDRGAQRRDEGTRKDGRNGRRQR